MSKISLQPRKAYPSLSSEELNRLLGNSISDTKISATKSTADISATKDNEFSATKDNEFSATKISDTKQAADISATKISATKISATKYMNDYKRDHYDTIRIDLPKGTKDSLKQEAMKRNISVTKLIRDAIDYYLEDK